MARNRTYVIQGNSRLSGKVQIQGSKNSGMKHVISPLLGDKKCVISNVPHIGSIDNLLNIISFLGGNFRWLEKNKIEVDPKGVESKRIPAKLFLYTSAGIHFVPILISRFGWCEVESDDGTYGGDRIGGMRTMERIMIVMEKFGVRCRVKGFVYRFEKIKDFPTKVDLPIKSFADTVNAIYMAVGENISTIVNNAGEQIEIDEISKMLNEMGADIKRIGHDRFEIRKHKDLKGIEHINACDRNDLVTWAVISLITKGRLEIKFHRIKEARLEAFWSFLGKIGTGYKLDKDSLKIIQNKNFKPVDVISFVDPDFSTDWQPLVGPLLTQIEGTSTIEERCYSDRLKYWLELGKMGAKYKFFKPKNCQFKDKNPHAVKIFGAVKLKGANVRALDVRAGAAMIIAGLAAEGQTVVENVEEIERGYEDIVKRLKGVGANIKERKFD